MFEKVLFYCVIIPLSWIPLDVTARLYRRWVTKCWPTQSLEFISTRDAAHREARQMGYHLRTEGLKVLAFTTRTT